MKSVGIWFPFCITAVIANTLTPKQIEPLKDPKVSEDRPKIISGQPAKLGQFPYQVAIDLVNSEGSFMCGGALICNTWVLTAAHCAHGAFLFNILLGSVTTDTVEASSVVVSARNATVHENYNPVSSNNDIALIRLDKPVNFTDNIQPIPLGKSRTSEGVTLTVSGWGSTANDSPPSPVLNYVNLTTISNAKCEHEYNTELIKESNLCCRGFPEHSSCHGDSGGPLVTQNEEEKFEHVGVVSFGSKAGCDSGRPSVYIRTESMLDWILKTIDGTCTLP